MRYMDLVPGDVFEYCSTEVEVLGPRMDWVDPFGRSLYKFWAKRADSATEGWFTFGPSGMLTPPADAVLEAGTHAVEDFT